MMMQIVAARKWRAGVAVRDNFESFCKKKFIVVLVRLADDVVL